MELPKAFEPSSPIIFFFFKSKPHFYKLPPGKRTGIKYSVALFEILFLFVNVNTITLGSSHFKTLAIAPIFSHDPIGSNGAGGGAKGQD